ncbi:MAG: histidine phosphatase family protein [Ruminococcaceae bacterium]|nr:histidine phosphatase family protein [Oscillospiraceae bacterium]
MAETTILLVRHGQSEGNILNVFTGHSGYSLSDLGHKQAALTAAYILGNYTVDAVYSSDLPRAFQTAEHIAKAFSLPIVTDCRVREINAGAWENKRFTDLPDLYPEDFTVWCEDLVHARCTGGESVSEVAERTENALREFAAANPGKCIVVVAHATTIRSMLWKLTGGTKEAMEALTWGCNCSVSKLTYTDGELQLESAYYGDHLRGFSTALPSDV